MAFSTKRTSYKVQGLDFGSSYNVRRNSVGSLIFETQDTARITLNYAGAVTFSGAVTITGAQTFTGAGTFSAGITVNGGTGVGDVTIAAGGNLILGGATNPTSGEGVLVMNLASEIGTSAGGSSQVILHAVSTASEGGGAATLAYTSSVATVTISNDALVNELSAVLTLIPINFNGTPLWIVSATTSV